MKQYCKQCGSCCTPCINISPQELGRYVRQNFPFFIKGTRDYYNNDFLLIISDMKPITHKQAHKINPYLKNTYDEDRYYYKCKNLGKDKKCKIHDKLRLGAMCDGYPWYKHMPCSGAWYCKDCGYKEELEDYVDE